MKRCLFLFIIIYLAKPFAYGQIFTDEITVKETM